MKTELKGTGEKGNWFIILEGRVALKLKRGMDWKDMMEVTKVIEENIEGVHIKK